MSRVPELLKAAASLSPETQAIEHLVHTVGLTPDVVAAQLGMSLPEVRTHLQAAREARHALALERERCPIVHHDDCTWTQVVEARQTRDQEIMEMIDQGLRANQVAARLGITVNIVYHAMTAGRQRRLAEMRMLKVSRRSGVDAMVSDRR